MLSDQIHDVNSRDFLATTNVQGMANHVYGLLIALLAYFNDLLGLFA